MLLSLNLIGQLAMTFRHLFFIAVTLLVAVPAAESEGQDRELQGIVQEQPADGVFVKCEFGFMVPYRETIPGTQVTFEMIPIPAGRFTIGSPESEAGRIADEGPRVSVEMGPFWMGKHEVTWGEYRPFMELVRSFKEFKRRGIREVEDIEQVDAVTAPSIIYDPSIPYEAGEEADTPAVTMTQFAAKQYTKWLSLQLGEFYRLPSEVEWEYACRAGSTTAYSFGESSTELSAYAWFDNNSEDRRHAVGQKLPNEWGLHDMHGNVAEWVLDGYSGKGYQAFDNGMATSRDAIHWPTTVYPRVARGGSWEMSADRLRSASRLASEKVWSDQDPGFPNSPWWHTSSPATGVGFRIVRPLVAPETVEQRDAFWKARVPQLNREVKECVENSGHGAIGLVDPQLADEIQALKEIAR